MENEKELNPPDLDPGSKKVCPTVTNVKFFSMPSERYCMKLIYLALITKIDIFSVSFLPDFKTLIITNIYEKYCYWN